MMQTMRSHYKLWCVAAVLVTVVFLRFVVYDQCLKQAVDSYQVLEDHNRAREQLRLDDGTAEDRTRYVLLYTSFFAESYWGLPAETLGPDYFIMKHCPVSNCVLTSNHGLLSSVTEYDAVVFHVATPLDVTLPKVRRTGQIYVAAVMESPAHTKHLLALEMNYFNWTMTYRLDSDILFNYLNIVDLESGEVIGPALRPSWRNGFREYTNASLGATVAQKRKMAAQFVSHCGALSRRDQLVEKMQSAGLEVDVYGSCGTKKCIRGNPECNKMLDTVYWFYLSFENSLCVDYVTEKLYNALEHNIVPVVFGGADYERFAPPGSYINAQDYATVSELVDYLLYLVDNPQEYVKYFWWKEHYALERTNSYCDVCQKLHSASTRTKVQYYQDIKAWWYDDACIAKSKIEF